VCAQQHVLSIKLLLLFSECFHDYPQGLVQSHQTYSNKKTPPLLQYKSLFSEPVPAPGSAVAAPLLCVLTLLNVPLTASSLQLGTALKSHKAKILVTPLKPVGKCYGGCSSSPPDGSSDFICRIKAVKSNIRRAGHLARLCST